MAFFYLDCFNLLMEVMQITSPVIRKPIPASKNVLAGNIDEQKTQKYSDNTSPNKCMAYFYPTFGVKNPEIALNKAEKIKAKLAQKELPYLLPNEAWSTQKIFQTIHNFGKDLDESIKWFELNKESLQSSINKYLPENIKGRIIIKDFSDLEAELRKSGYPEDIIASNLQDNAATNYSHKDGNIVSLYLNFDKAYINEQQTIDFKSDVEHELKHALSFTMQNKTIIDIYKNNCSICHNQAPIFNKIFNLFEHSFQKEYALKSTNLTQQNMLNWQGLSSIDELHNKFETTLNDLIQVATSKEILSIKSNKRQKQFFATLKHRAQDEKEAYHSQKRYREALGNLNKPTNAELLPLLYAEMEKFFAKKEHHCKN